MDTLRSDDFEVNGLRQRVVDLESCVERLSERISELEKGDRTGLVPRTIVDAPPRADSLSAPSSLPILSSDAPVAAASPWIALAGRTFLVLAGAFLLRALTDSGSLPPTPGVWIGLAYASMWIVMADRRPGPSGLVHGLTSLMIALPLTVEAASRFHVLGPIASAIVLALLAFAALGVAWRRRLVLLALAALLGAVATALAVAAALDAFLAPTLVVIALGIAAAWIAHDRQWPVVAWPAAAAADLAVLFLTVRAAITPPRDEPLAAIGAHALLALGYLAVFLWRTRRPPREVGAFEIAQTMAVLTLAIGDTTLLAQAHGLSQQLIGVPALVLGIALYTQAFARELPARGAGRQFTYVGMTAFVLTMAGLMLVVGPGMRAAVTAAVAVIFCLVASRRSEPLLALQGSIAGVLSAGAGGLFAFAGVMWLSHPAAWPSPQPVLILVLASVIAALLIPRALRHEQPSAMAIVARLALAATFIVGVGSLVVLGIGPTLAGTPPNAGILATAKTVILVTASFGAALASRVHRFGELRWLAYGLLGAGALKILLEDLPASSPSTLFVALAAYGAALIVVPKIVRKA